MDLRNGRMTWLRCALGVLATVVLIFVPTRHAESALAPQIVRAFSASASTPNGLIQARDGNFYGTTDTTLFRMTPGGTLTTLHVFDCSSEGCGFAALMQATDGHLYGVNSRAVFKATLGGVVMTLHAFDCATEGCGSEAALVEDGEGNFLGTTSSGGPLAAGSVFKITPTGEFSTLYEFCKTDGCPDGANPSGRLVRATDGNFYGTTASGGAFFGGTAFRLTRIGNITTLTTLHDFDFGADGGVPAAGLIQAKDGHLYGATQSGGALGNGTIFKLALGGSLKTLHSFDCGIEGCGPRTALIQAKDGAFYGTTPAGGVFEGGTIFRLGQTGAFTTLHAVNCKTEGCNSAAALVQAIDGYFYGTTSQGGPGGGGTVFKMTPNGAITTLQAFGCTSSDGCFPRGALTQAKDGTFYGTTSEGGRFRGGTVFRLTPGGVLTTLHSFECAADGCSPQAALIQASDGNLYGTTRSGGAFDGGTAFKLTPGGVFTRLHAFDCSTDGCGPQAALIQASDGYLYGTTPLSGPDGGGTVFKLALNGAFNTLHAFDCGPDGCSPYGGVIQASDGHLYGTTAYGNGSFSSGGTVFRLTLGGALTTLHVFDCLSNDGCGLFSTLIQASDGNLYGTAAYNGPIGSWGTVFNLTLDGDDFSTLHTFDDLDGEACQPNALMQARDGNLYGNYVQCGGGIYKLSLEGEFAKLADCAVVCPSFDNALIHASDGYLYGTSGFGGGPEGGGSVFRLVELVPNTLTALSAARVWIGLRNSDDVGARLDLRAEVRQNSTLIGSGEVLSVAGGSSGFNNAKLHTIPLALSSLDPMSFGDADIFSITVYVRNACTGSGKSSVTARLWFNDVAANSRFGATIAGDDRDYFLRSGFTLSTTAGASRQSVDASSAGKCGPFVPLGTWRIVPQ